MKNLIRVSLMTIFFLPFGIANAEDWKIIGILSRDKADERKVYIDNESKRFDRKTKIVEVWVKFTYKNSESVSKQLFSANCKTGELALVLSHSYDKDGKHTKSKDYRPKLEWDKVVPGTTGYLIYRDACKRTFLQKTKDFFSFG